jgi:basic membrane protein A
VSTLVISGTPSKRGFSTAFHILAALTLSACAGSDKASERTPDRAPGRAPHTTIGRGGPAGHGDFSAALLTPGPISDQSWNGGAYAGLLRIRDSLGARVSHVQTRTPAEFEEQFRQYGAQGYDLVFGHGFEFQDAARRVGPDFPRTVYVTTSSATSGTNVAGIEFGFANSSYLAGLVAGTITKTGVVGTIGGTELPPVKESFAAFARGARDANPRVRVLSSYVGNWDDVGAGHEQALAQISRNADVIFQNADAAGLGVFQAARETRKALVVGSNANQNAIAPEVTLGSVAIDLPHAFLTIAREVRGGHFIARVIHLGTAEDVVSLVLNPALVPRLPTPLVQRVDSLQREMRAGRFTAPTQL